MIDARARVQTGDVNKDWSISLRLENKDPSFTLKGDFSL